jgi:hypothetical protein
MTSFTSLKETRENCVFQDYIPTNQDNLKCQNPISTDETLKRLEI